MVAIILQRLRSLGIELPSSFEQETRQWIFTKQLSEKDVHFFSKLVANHVLLNLEYTIFCTQLARDLFQGKATDRQIETALMLAELLENIYQDYLIVPREVSNIRRERDVYRKLLAVRGYRFGGQAQDEIAAALTVQNQMEQLNPNYLLNARDKGMIAQEHDLYQMLLRQQGLIAKAHPSHQHVTKSIREKTTSINTLRLFLTRTRRFLIALNQYTNNHWLAKMEQFSAPVMPYIVWIFFAPRLMANLFITFKHLIPACWMDEKERSMNFWLRLIQQLERRWLELGNDLVWFVGGVVIFYAITKGMISLSVTIGLVLQIYDFLQAVTRAAIELPRLHDLERYYLKLLAEKKEGSEEAADVKNYLDDLQKRIVYEELRLYLSLTNNTVMLISVCLALPFFAFNPAFALIGGVIAVLNSIGCYIANHYIEEKKPKNDLGQLSGVVAHRFFKPSSPNPPDGPSDCNTREDMLVSPTLA